MNGNDAYQNHVVQPPFKSAQDVAQALAVMERIPAHKGEPNILEQVGLLESVGGFSQADVRAMIVSAYGAEFANFIKKKDVVPDDIARLRGIHAAIYAIDNKLALEALTIVKSQKVPSVSTPLIRTTVSSPESVFTQLITERLGVHAKVSRENGNFLVTVPGNNYSRGNFENVGFTPEDTLAMIKSPANMKYDTWVVRGAEPIHFISLGILPERELVSKGFGDCKQEKKLNPPVVILRNIVGDTEPPIVKDPVSLEVYKGTVTISIPEKLVQERLPELFAKSPTKS